ncbi:MAG: lipo-like protein [Comamonadaceae bacterium CG1_02_60_18]|nr:MAG: lipo-like protein [Comamonadaceae bacterium CG1_02_60_18]PIQ53086.1 MAG: lipo-like protein [Comamonadaceae bacterium CG12_big_fil_rev_8_21_14_0_65_59_15]
MNTPLTWLGRQLARFLAKEVHVHSAVPATPPARLLATLRLGDVLLVEGHSRISSAIKYLTQSTWSHAALYVGDALVGAGKVPAASDHCFIEADTVQGVRGVGISEFAGLHSRICRPVGLSAAECAQVTAFAIARIGSEYDLRNVLDLARYLLPAPPVPQRFRRKLLALGSGDPTRAICSTLIAQAFQSIHYPILPITAIQNDDRPDCPACVKEILIVRHHSLFAPRDFDVSPYFQVVKPTIEAGFDFHALKWGDGNLMTA